MRAIVHQVLKEQERRSDRLTGLVTPGQGISKPALMQRLDWDTEMRTAAWQSRLLVTAGMASTGPPAPCEEVFNSGSVFFDHNVYPRNHDELLPRLINDLVRAASEEPTRSYGYQLVSRERIAAPSRS